MFAQPIIPFFFTLREMPMALYLSICLYGQKNRLHLGYNHIRRLNQIALNCWSLAISENRRNWTGQTKGTHCGQSL